MNRITISDESNHVTLTPSLNQASVHPFHNHVLVEEIKIESDTFFLTQFQTYREDKEVE